MRSQLSLALLFATAALPAHAQQPHPLRWAASQPAQIPRRSISRRSTSRRSSWVWVPPVASSQGMPACCCEEAWWVDSATAFVGVGGSLLGFQHDMPQSRNGLRLGEVHVISSPTPACGAE